MSTSDKLFDTWFELQRQLIPKLQRAYLQVQGPSVPGGALTLQHPAQADAPAENLVLAARLAQQSRSPVSGETREGGASPLLRIACPLQLENHYHGAIVVETTLPLTQQASVIQSLQSGAAWLRFALQAQPSQAGDSPYGRLARIAETHADYPALLTASLLMLKQLGNSTRVACGQADGAKITLEGISETSDLDPRSGGARRLIAAMQEALAGEPQTLWIDTQGAQGHPAHAALAQENRAGAILTLVQAVADGQALLFSFEFADPPADPDHLLARCRDLVAIATPSLAARRARRGSWWQRQARLLREGLSALFSPLTRNRRLVQVAAGVLLLLFLLSDTTHRVTAKAVVEAASQQTLAVPFEGFIAEAPVRAGESVQQGALLARLEDRELKTRQRGLLAEAAELRKKHRQAVATGKLSEARVLEAKFEQTRSRLDLVEEQLAQTEIRAPLSGIVISGDWQRAIGSPVARGDTLFELAPLDNYRVTLLAEDRDIAWLSPQQTGELVLAALPSQTLQLRLGEIVTIADSETLSPVFRVEARLGEEPEALRPGMQGVAKVVVGERPRWWVWSHDLLDWLRLHLWRWLP